MKISKAQISKARANLKAAPAKEAAGSVRAAILQMRSELMAALIEKNWSFAELRDWLAAQGIEVSLAALQRYLVGVRAAKKAAAGRDVMATSAPKAASAQTPPALPAPTSGKGRAHDAPPRPVPPMPRPLPPMPKPQLSGGQGAQAPDPSVPRASSFPVRRDRENI
jgi:hypothetical protein